ncbi:hypothetical protein [Methylomonas methanica]|uniref:Secreted protein n=1 Tax=Methylomonas methanica (strain DSM 25384 / MC09) TaxID=857087 RepID=G0A2R9_METMM|nr:hypothetical protein [Methylomonas methanica]AEG01422.1 hypothetical protein Metme_3044 [Methylomonas methanica MC09]
MRNLKLASAGVFAFSVLTGLIAPGTASAALVTGNATFTIDNPAVVSSNPGGWFFETHWGPNDNALPIDGATGGGTALTSTSGSEVLVFPVNTNIATVTLSTTGAGRIAQATTMDAGNTAVGQIGLSGALRMRNPGMTTYLAPFDLAVSKSAGEWSINSHDNSFGTVGLFKLANVSESLNGNGELLLSGDLLWTGGLSYGGLLNANTSIVLGSFNLAPAAVPVPAAVWLFGSGLLGLLSVARGKMTLAA